jgi:hypothetical protein
MRSKRKRILLGLGLLVVAGFVVARLTAPPRVEAWLESVKAVGRTNLLGQYDREVTVRYRFGEPPTGLLYETSVQIWRDGRWAECFSTKHGYGNKFDRPTRRRTSLQAQLGPWLTNLPAAGLAPYTTWNFNVPPEAEACRFQLEYARLSSVNRQSRLFGRLGLDPWGKDWPGRLNQYLCAHMLIHRSAIVLPLPPLGAEFTSPAVRP